MSQAGKKTRCGYMGIVGKSAIGRKSPGSYLIYKKDRVQGVKLSRDPESKEIVVGETTLDVKPTETDAVAKWADDNEGIVRFFLDGKAFSYDEAIQVMSSIVYKCEDMQVNLDEMGAKKLTVPCGKAKKRDITLVFGLCS